MSNASSISSNDFDSAPGSYTGKPRDAEDPYGSALNLGEQSDQGESAGSEPMFNFRSLAEVVGVSIDGEEDHPDNKLKYEGKSEHHEEAQGEHVEHVVSPRAQVPETGDGEQRKPTAIDTTSHPQTRPVESLPDLLVTPETPAPIDDDDEDAKQLGHHLDTKRRSNEVTQ
ncbi:hypothetical protein NPX13_g6897 [Xylaria arbuscula]|uniref:Uncharacterized protein n=1 Tax=Xylaria arbuscula TaxID=114810 RepID=A0A9W8NBC7_9PEZI|nr:hypothetical protein NPX13_g6897 [Xylaria arbuscula]